MKARYHTVGDEERGPTSQEEPAEMTHRGVVRREDLVWSEDISSAKTSSLLTQQDDRLAAISFYTRGELGCTLPMSPELDQKRPYPSRFTLP